jgi:hypothetical protein
MAPSRLSIISRARKGVRFTVRRDLSCNGADSVPIDEAGWVTERNQKDRFLRFEIGKLHRLKQTVLKILPFVCRGRRAWKTSLFKTRAA